MQQVKIVGGYNPFDFGYTLAPESSLKMPVFYGGVAQHGLEEMSHLESQFQLTKVLPQAPHPRPRPVLYNSWEATEFNFDEKTQEGLADKAASIGVERFVMDDGWFSTRVNDKSGLGDWYPNPQTVSERAEAADRSRAQRWGWTLGCGSNPRWSMKTAIYTANIRIGFSTSAGVLARRQDRSSCLNLAMPEVQEYLIGFLDKLLKENDISFLKWDCESQLLGAGMGAGANRRAEEDMDRATSTAITECFAPYGSDFPSSRSNHVPGEEAASTSV